FLKGPKTDGEMAPELPTLYKEEEITAPRLVAETKATKSCGSSKQVA
ncbi:MAG: hypothetical protein ACI85N_000947, partial [Gammaproteobacteria bacterium]